MNEKINEILNLYFNSIITFDIIAVVFVHG